MVLATQSEAGPYCSLMVFAVTPDMTNIALATPRSTRKYENMIAHPVVSLLADNRENGDDDPHGAMAVTVLGTATELAGSPADSMKRLLMQAHPRLKDFLNDADTAVFAVSVSRYIVVEDFQDVQEIFVRQLNDQERA